MSWVGAYLGSKIDLDDPRPEQFTLEEIARGLASMPRFAGQTEHHYSVAQHSLLVEKMVCAESYVVALQRAALLHDASEAYMGDVPTPVKQRCPEYLAIEDRVMRAVAQRFDFDWPMYAAVKRADDRVVHIEKRLLQPRGPRWERAGDPNEEPRVTIYWRDPRAVEREFLARARELGCE